MNPIDEHDRELLSHVHPPDWVNPTPSGRYNLVVIGAGSAGLVTAAGAAGLGARVALVERNLMGGDCLNTGCVPSKALIRAARVAADARRANAFGITVSDVGVRFPDVMTRMRALRAGIAPHDAAARFRDLGVDVFIGTGTFVGKRSLEVVGDHGNIHRLSFKRAVIATGARASMPPIPGLESVGALTHESVFSLTELPTRLGIIGAGPIGCELAQTFQRFGSDVSLFERADRVLPREAPDASQIVCAALESDGVSVQTLADIASVEKVGDVIRVALGDTTVEVDALFVAAGRKPNIEKLGLDAAGVARSAGGLVLDDRLRSSNRHIFAAGDVATRFHFTHAADATARVVLQNALFHGRAKASALTIPWATYTEPEVSHVGHTTASAAEAGLAIDTFEQPMSGVDRAILDGDTTGFVRVHVRKGTDRIVGATIVASHAGDMIAELSLAMTHNLGLGAIASTIHPYPTQQEGIKRVADAYNRTRLKPWVHRLFQRYFRWFR